MTIPNLISIFRIILVPVFVLIALSDVQNANIIAIAVFLLAGVSDVVDGRIARKYNCTSVLGKILDPLADKMMVSSALLCAGFKGLMPIWFALIYVAKELVQCCGGLLLYRRIKDMVPSNILGKATTIFFYLTIVCLFLMPQLPEWTKTTMIVICLALIVMTFAFYASKAVQALKCNKEEKKDEV